jgi:thiamine pyrophosphate-dependent acetolactate synthase large subunit-like protein
MEQSDGPRTGAEVIVKALREHGIRHVFGYPGGQLTPLYDALNREPGIRHILARDEQAAAFMADGYARATGEPGVCLAVCGPGVFNAATPLASAFTDSVPILLISGQTPKAGRGPRSGYYHENDQIEACASFTKWRACLDEVHTIRPQLDLAMATLTGSRPGPVLLEIPLDILRAQPADLGFPTQPTIISAPAAKPAEIDSLAKLIQAWRKPLILAGGGVNAAGAEKLLVQVAERLGAPVFHTFMGKGVIPADHPLAAGLPWFQATSDLTDMDSFISPLFKQADGLLAVGCRFSQTCTANWKLPIPPSLAHIDVDRSEIGRHYPVKLGIHSNAKNALSQLLEVLPSKPKTPWAPATSPRPPWRLPGIDLLGPIRRVLPRDAIISADITRLSYIMLAEFPVYEPRTFLHPAGFVCMGYGLPAALGAKAAFPDRTVVAVLGDGCFLMSGMELATAVQEKLPVIVVLINDHCLTLIKAIQERRYENRFLGVDLENPDFSLLAKAFGVGYWRADTDPVFEKTLHEAVQSKQPALIEVQI